MTQIGRIHKAKKKERRGKLTDCEHQHVVALLCVAGADVEWASVWCPPFHFALGVVVVLQHNAVEGLGGFVAQRLDRVVVITLPPDFIERTSVNTYTLITGIMISNSFVNIATIQLLFYILSWLWQYKFNCMSPCCYISKHNKHFDTAMTCCYI